MKAMIKIRHVCGCETEHEITWDGRRKLEYGWLPENCGDQPAATWGEAPPRALAEMRIRSANPVTELCIKCFLSRSRATIQALVPTLKDPWLPLDMVRGVARVAALTGGKVSQSPKSSSLYVTWASGAWRISDHPWPGRSESLVSEKKIGRRFAARLTPDWLAWETGLKVA